MWNCLLRGAGNATREGIAKRLPQATLHLNGIEDVLGPLLKQHLFLALAPTVLHFKKLVNFLKC